MQPDLPTDPPRRPDGPRKERPAGPAPGNAGRPEREGEVGPRGRSQDAPDMEHWSDEQVRRRAEELAIEGRADMTREGLVRAILDH